MMRYAILKCMYDGMANGVLRNLFNSNPSRYILYFASMCILYHRVLVVDGKSPYPPYLGGSYTMRCLKA